ncbi:MFS transporter [Synechococcus sp. CS-1329]|uniref:MFS transporter n=1 Tax=Synechococcus sp. CS-1329 TaxID=2847975 RepID=UPI00223A97BE|nr:MFS transporter [Synechococcus sp. CS-1329]MCT0217780.1 MFS transporter [Synechococcus sp. CS-1329]
MIRLVGSFGAGGILYLTPVVFHQAQFSALAVGQGLAAAALAGTVGRLLSGWWLDHGLSTTRPVLLAALISVVADSRLFSADTFAAYVLGQVLLGLAMGIYWPAIELAVPLSAPPLPSSRAYALVRTGDALGAALGVLLGALLASSRHLRGIYLLDIACMLVVISLLLRSPLPMAVAASQLERRLPWRQWVKPLLPLLGVTLLATAMLSLLQSALPLDLVRGGLERAPLSESIGALLLGLQLSLLLLLQWPLGRWLAQRPVAFGLGWSLLGFALGSLLLALSALGWQSLPLLVLAQLPLAAAAAAFLPTASEAVIEVTPASHQGMALALFSQCFAISSFVAPLVGGWLLENQKHGAGLWLLMTLLSLLGLLLVGELSRFHPHAAQRQIQPRL